MGQVQIITDSSAYIPKQYVDELDIAVVPLQVNWQGKSYKDGVDISADEFYKQLINANEVPTTSPTSVHEYTEAIKRGRSIGKELLILPISSVVSASIKSAYAAQKVYAGEPVEIVDTKLTSMALGLMVIAAARAAKAGSSLAQCKAIAEIAFDHIGLLFVVETLKYLRLGGRIGAAKNLLGTALNIKPILTMKDGANAQAGSAVSKPKAIEKMIEMAKEMIANQSPVTLSVMHAMDPEDASKVLEMGKKEFKPTETILAELSPVIGAHVGPGTIAIAWMAGM